MLSRRACRRRADRSVACNYGAPGDSDCENDAESGQLNWRRWKRVVARETGVIDEIRAFA